MSVKSNRSERLLVLKGNTFWFRQSVPKGVHQVIGGAKFIMLNLQTSNITEAKHLRDDLEATTRVQFRDILRGRRVAFEFSGVSIASTSTSHSQALPAALRGELTRNAMADAEDNDELFQIVEAAEAEADAMRPAQREAFERAMMGKVEIEEHLEDYLSKAELAPKTTNERRGHVMKLARWCSERGKTLDQIDRREAGRYVSEELDQMHPVTQGKHITALRQYWIYLARRGHVQLPVGETVKTGWPWNDQQVEKKGKRVERGATKAVERPFTDTEASTLLNSPFPLREAYKAPMQDILRTSLFSGMRQAEIITLWVEEVVTDDDGLWFNIQQGKTDAAARMVPVHSSLEGMIRARMANKSGHDMLFHELSDASNPSDTFGKRFKRYREALGVDDKQPGVRRSLVNFHSARRWFATKARHAGIDKDTIADVIGHRPDKQDVTFGRYARGASRVQLRGCVEAVKVV
ncbi:Site-specific recombinase XerD [Yoonia tamlensis]|uniref:Site-specific recombinase XerD n=1 Tax=Yoonia tamlensis TaxID=390270 RepID=A0A1I6FTD7_9RHOB|nr:tyrosine-type recombinase/integrase [Yoonia tamlensis]SFR33191.1 Site-specific recombinase XerD [Yoonia tamlensis]